MILELVESIHKLLYFLPFFSFIVYKNKRSEIKRVVFYFMTFLILHELIFDLFRVRYPFAMYFFNQLFVPIEFLFILAVFKYSFNSFRLKQSLYTLYFLFLFFCLVINLFSTPKSHYNDIINVVEALIIIVLCALYYFEQMNNPNTLFIYKESAFWFISGIFIFFCGSFFVFLYDRIAINVEGFLEQYVYLHSFFNITRSLIFSFTMKLNPTKQQMPFY